jgi:hypothetical protein
VFLRRKMGRDCADSWTNDGLSATVPLEQPLLSFVVRQDPTAVVVLKLFTDVIS